MLSMVATLVPCVSNPDHSNEHRLSSVLLGLKVVCLLLQFVELVNDCFLGQIYADLHIIEGKCLTEQFLSDLSGLGSAPPIKLLPIVLDCSVHED